MKIFELLNNEMKSEPEGVLAPYYFKYLGYKIKPSASPSELRANMIHSLFSLPHPVILKNELFAGNLRSLFVHEDRFVLDCARAIMGHLSERSFATNKDHYAPNYAHILDVGITGLIDETEVAMRLYHDDDQKLSTLSAMKKTLQGFIKMIENYADEAYLCAKTDTQERERLLLIHDCCRTIAHEPPQSFRQALQLVWFCHLAFLMEGRAAMAFGRMDQYLYRFYKKDTENGILSDDEAIELLENIFIRLQDDVVNICIGGQNAYGECQINDLSRCILRAVRSCNVPGPNLSLRYTQNTPDDFFEECIETIGTGLGYPAIMNDDVNIAALKKYGYPDEDVFDYSMVGCIENFITGKQPPWSDGRFDTPRFIDYVFNCGVSRFNRSLGLDLGDVEDIGSMDDFMSALEKELSFGVSEYCAIFTHRNDSINQKLYPEPFLSCFCQDCIGRGLDINDGGSIYPSVHGVGLMGIGTMADSLAAIEKVVFLDRAATLSELRDAMNDDFVGHEKLRELLINAPKYGNNDDFVDKYAVWFVVFLSSEFRKYKTRDGGGIYVAAAANTSNIGAGKIINATPDGRKRGEPLSDAASPTYGRDVRGATAAVNSLVKPDYTNVACGSVVNQKYSPSAFNENNRKKLMALIKTYFKKGGQEIQINATSREILIDAMEHPEKYPSLVVRVSGFSAFYVTLARDVQIDILNRTQQE